MAGINGVYIRTLWVYFCCVLCAMHPWFLTVFFLPSLFNALDSLDWAHALTSSTCTLHMHKPVNPPLISEFSGFVTLQLNLTEQQSYSAAQMCNCTHLWLGICMFEKGKSMHDDAIKRFVSAPISFGSIFRSCCNPISGWFFPSFLFFPCNKQPQHWTN